MLEYEVAKPNFITRSRQALKYVLSTNTLDSSSIGSVLRNYARQSEFRPSAQLKGITYKAVDKIGLSVSTYQPIVNKSSDEAFATHPIMTLAQQPNPRQDGTYFHHLEAMLYEIYGETFWYKALGERSGKTKELYLLQPSQMELVVHDGELLGYVLHKANGGKVPFELDEIIHSKRPNPFNEWRGMSVMERAAQYIDIELTTTSFTLNYMNNNASPSGIVGLPEMNQEAFKQFTMQWRENYEGPENAGKTAFIRGAEASFKAVGATLKDIDQKVTRDMAKDDVLMMFDMPKGLLGAAGDKGLGRSETEALEYVFAKWKIEPMMLRLDAIYRNLLTNGNYNDRANTITHTSPIPDDKQYILDQNEKGVSKWITVNEARQSQGLPPIKGYDVLPPINTPTKAPTDPPAKSATAKRVVLAPKLSKSEQLKKKNQEQEAFRKEVMDTSEIYSRKIKSAIAEFADDQQKEIIGKINATSKAYEEWLFSVKDESEKLASLLVPIIIELMETQSEDVANFITGELLVISPEIRKAVESQALRVAGVYNTDTLQALEKTLTEGQTQGESLAKLKKRVEAEYSQAKGYRAERIARTESARASNSTAELVYKQNGFTKVEWFINPGACEFCKTYAGRTKTIGSVYTPIGEVVDGVDGGQLRIEYSNIETPPLHPNCTCSLVPVS